MTPLRKPPFTGWRKLIGFAIFSAAVLLLAWMGIVEQSIYSTLAIGYAAFIGGNYGEHRERRHVVEAKEDPNLVNTRVGGND